MNESETEQLQMARQAATRWAAFPVAAQPRPLVLAQADVTTDEGFSSWFEGQYEWAVAVPDGVRARAQHRADRVHRDSTRDLLIITAAGRSDREVRTDRGPITLPQYWLKGPAIGTTLWVLAPEIEHWEPAQPPLHPGRLMGSMLRPFAPHVESNGRSITVPWTGAGSADYRLELIETDTAIAAIAVNITKPGGPSRAQISVGRRRWVSGELSEPIGNRVFVDLCAEALPVMRPEDLGLASQ